MHVNPISTKDKCRHHPFGAKMLPGIFIRYALNSGGGWAGDLIIADWDDVTSFLSEEVEINKNCRKYQIFLAQMVF